MPPMTCLILTWARMLVEYFRSFVEHHFRDLHALNGSLLPFFLEMEEMEEAEMGQMEGLLDYNVSY